MDGFDTGTPHPARRYNYWLGGADHFAADRASGDAIAAAFPTVVELARANRRFLRRSVEFLAGAGVRQFLDIGAGLPAPDSTHEVAERIAPGSRVVGVDNDPIVMARARPQPGRTAYLEADLRDPAALLANPVLRESLDFSRPVGLLMLAVLHFVHDDAVAAAAVARLLAALPPGSYLALSHGTMDFSTPEGVTAYEKMFAAGGTDVRARDRATLSGWLGGLEIVPPGLVPVGDWRPRDSPAGRPMSQDLGIYAVVGRV